jgi:hypothetical protein
LDDVHDHDPHRRAALVRRDSLLDRQAAAQDRHAGAKTERPTRKKPRSAAIAILLGRSPARLKL